MEESSEEKTFLRPHLKILWEKFAREYLNSAVER